MEITITEQVTDVAIEENVVTVIEVTPFDAEEAAAAGHVFQLLFPFDGGTAAVDVGKHFAVPMRIAGTIVRATMVGGDASGSCVIDIRKVTYATYSTSRPNSGDSICASSKPTISGGVKSEDSTLTGWATAVAIGDVLMAYVESWSTMTWACLSLEIEPA